MTEFIVRVVQFCRRYALLVALCFFALAGVGVWIAGSKLSVDTNTDNLFASTLPWRQHATAFDREFPQFNNVLAVVVRGVTPEESDETAAQLAKALENYPDHGLPDDRRRADW